MMIRAGETLRLEIESRLFAPLALGTGTAVTPPGRTALGGGRPSPNGSRLTSPTTPCTITVTVNTANIGNPSSSSLLEEVGTYAFASGRSQSAETNPNAEADQLPLQIDGICCFNFAGNGIGTPVPETPWMPALIGVGVLLIGAGSAVRRRRHSDRPRTAH